MIERGRCWAITQQGNNCSETFRLEGLHQSQNDSEPVNLYNPCTHRGQNDYLYWSVHTTRTPKLYTLCFHINSWASFPWHSHLYRYPQGTADTLAWLAKLFTRASPSLHKRRWYMMDIQHVCHYKDQPSHRLDGIAIKPYCIPPLCHLHPPQLCRHIS